ncbi:hypothetical protein [Methyloligella solikamskensis]|uniref:Uncharacterized protein n=1 Tax=Methyloligella solikamskensis TaxID=1177756 RepID=A0ABW3J952_9HYPH
MARKQKAKPQGFVLFDVVYEDGTQTSNRKVPATELAGLEGDAPARDIIEDQDRKIVEASGVARAPIKSISRSPSTRSSTRGRAAEAAGGV